MDFSEVFSPSKEATQFAEHSIPLTGVKAIAVASYGLSDPKKQHLRTELDKLL